MPCNSFIHTQDASLSQPCTVLVFSLSMQHCLEANVSGPSVSSSIDTITHTACFVSLASLYLCSSVVSMQCFCESLCHDSVTAFPHEGQVFNRQTLLPYLSLMWRTVSHNWKQWIQCLQRNNRRKGIKSIDFLWFLGRRMKVTIEQEMKVLFSDLGRRCQFAVKWLRWSRMRS